MKLSEILENTEHRPWEIPKSSWRFYQEWNDVLFLHWQTDLEELQKFVPEELEIDLFEGKPWISVVAFAMEKIRPRYMPAFAPISNFLEINVRTYIKKKGKTGVYFLSMEGGKNLSCQVAKSISKLPYRYSKIKREEQFYDSSNTEFEDQLNIQFSIGEPTTTKTDLERWLTERYALFQDDGSFINEYEIHHTEWPLKALSISNMALSYPRFKNLIGREPDLINYSEGVQVIAWGKKKIAKADWRL
ncbi:YqjF family protein [Flavobacterium microcysteis]